MAVQKQKKSSADIKSVHWPFGPKNYILFGIALADITLGFVQLNSGSITAAPILLVLGFCVLIPAAIMVDGLPKKQSDDLADMSD